MTNKVRWCNAVRPLRISRISTEDLLTSHFFHFLGTCDELLIKYSLTKNILEQTTLRFSKIILDQVSQRVLQGGVVSTDKFLISIATKQHFSGQDVFGLKIVW